MYLSIGQNVINMVETIMFEMYHKDQFLKSDFAFHTLWLKKELLGQGVL